MTLLWMTHPPVGREEESESPPGQPSRVLTLPSGVQRNGPPPSGTGPVAKMWVPLGPSVTLDGQADLHPRVSGRIRAFAATNDGQRIYAGTALGGTWYSGDGGQHWLPLDFYSSTKDVTGKLGEASALAVGAIAVRFGAQADGSGDEVFVGTGEQPEEEFSADPGAVQGVGIRVATGPAATVTTGGPAADPWTLEATNLAGAAILRLAVGAGTVFAATTRGLFRRPSGGGTNWERVDTGLGNGRHSDVVVTIGEGTEAQRIVAALASGKVAWSVTGADGTWGPVSLPAFSQPATGRLRDVAFVALAAGNTPGQAIVYALADGPRLWRIRGSNAVRVTGLPADLFGTQASYDMAIAVHPGTAPADQDRIVVGGSTRCSKPLNANGSCPSEWNASLYAAKLAQDGAGNWSFPVSAGDPPPEWIGGGVHADIHQLAWLPGPGGADPPQLWVASDGGLFRSKNDGAAGSFESCNTGLASIEGTFLAEHPTTDSVVLLGTQDNGVVRRLDVETWRVAAAGDAGGVAIDPLDPRRMLAQYTQSDWRRSTDGGRLFYDVTLFTPAPAAGTAAQNTQWANAQKKEHDASLFYSGAAAIADRATTELAVGTDRAWLSNDWGSTWVTIPTATDPYAAATAGAPNRTQDVLDGSPVSVLRWGKPDQLYAMTADGIWVLDRDGAGNWGTVQDGKRRARRLYDRPKVESDRKGKDPPSDQIPDDMPLTELAVHDINRGTGSLYAGTTGRGRHHIWWYDGVNAWTDAGFAVDTPVHALVVDPLHHEVVYAGTDVGLWMGVQTFGADGKPSWTWELHSDGLPEAACVDLAIRGSPRLLRAALRGRGVWEMPLDGQTQGPMAFVRANAYDTRRLPVAVGVVNDPMSNPASPTVLRLDASPDIRVYRAAGTDPPQPTTFALGLVPDSFSVWALQSALRVAGAKIPVDGFWTSDTQTALQARKAALTTASDQLPPAPLLDASVWNRVVGGAATNAATSGPNANKLAFDHDPPDAADLVALLRDEPDRRAAPTASCATGDQARVYVTVHGRDWRPLTAASVAVFLLQTPFNGNADLSGIALLPDDWATHVVADLTAAPGTAGGWLGGSGWSYARPSAPFERPGRPVDPREPQVVTFDLTLSTPAWPAGGWLLLAVVQADDDPLTAIVRDVASLVRLDHHVAARSVRRFA